MGGTARDAGPAHGEQAELGRAQVVIPVPDRDRLVQDGRDPGVRTCLAPSCVVTVRVAVRSGTRCGHHRTGDDDRAGPFGSFQCAYAAGPASTGTASPPPAGSSHAAGCSPPAPAGCPGAAGLVRPVSGSGSGADRAHRLPAGPLRDKEQGPVRQEARIAFAVRRPGQAARGVRAPRSGRDRPDAGDVRLQVRGQRLDRRGQPAAVGRQPQRRDPRDRHVTREIVEGRPARRRGGTHRVSVIMAAPAVAFVASSIRIMPPVSRFRL